MRKSTSRQVLLLFLMLTFGVQLGQAYELRGSLSSDLYYWEDSVEEHWRPYETLRASLFAARSSDNRFVAFHTNLRWTTDLRNKFPDDPQTFVYDAQVQLSGLIRNADIRLGRMYAYCGIGSALIDGARVKYALGKRFTVDVFGGSEVSWSDPEKVRSFGDYGVLGGRLSYHHSTATQFGLNWIDRQYEGTTAMHRLAVDGEYSPRTYRLFGRVAYDLVDLRLAEALGRISFNPESWYFNFEFNWREPSVRSNSIFSIVDTHRYQQARLEARRKLKGTLYLTGRLDLSVNDSDDTWRTYLGLSQGGYSLGWRHQTGYGGLDDAVFGSLNVAMGRQWELYSGANVSSYRIQDGEEERNEVYTVRMGLKWRSWNGLQAGGEVQYLRNPLYESDVRVLVNVTKYFGYKSKPRSETP